MTKVSVAIPVFEYYGRGLEFLDDLLRTISYQTLKGVEIIVSDHSLNDDIENYCNDNEYQLNIKYFRNENGRGNPAINTNNAIDKCSGEIIKIFQQDDFFYDTEALEIMYREMSKSSEKWFVCGTIHTRDDGNTFFHPILPRWDEKMIVEDQHNFIGGLSVLSIKNEVKTKFDENVRMLLDVDYYYNTMLEYGMPILYQDVLIANRVRDFDSLSSEITSDDIEKEFLYVNTKYNV